MYQHRMDEMHVIGADTGRNGNLPEKGLPYFADLVAVTRCSDQPRTRSAEIVWFGLEGS
jgi:hypothetical protein